MRSRGTPFASALAAKARVKGPLAEGAPGVDAPLEHPVSSTAAGIAIARSAKAHRMVFPYSSARSNSRRRLRADFESVRACPTA
jgi:hypothetical protein